MPTDWEIEPSRVAHGPFEKMGLICRAHLRQQHLNGGLPLRGPAVRRGRTTNAC
jgi:hypothetical protein